MSEEKITIRKGDDMHVHFRTGDILKTVVGFTARQFKRAVIMPNTTNPNTGKPAPILTADNARRYYAEITNRCGNEFDPLMTIQITDNTTPEIIAEAKKAGVIAGKVYPLGVTTNSQNGLRSYREMDHVWEAMEQAGMLLLLHGESPEPDVFCLDREEKFLSVLEEISEGFPKLKIVLEHITTAPAVQAVRALDNVAATITAHHLLLTLDDVVGDKLSPHNFCKPLAKRPHDRQALIASATSGSPKFFFGSDSAPHLRLNKECSQGCAGCFTAPIALPLLTQVFEEIGALDKLENFTSKFGTDFYGLPQNVGAITLVKKDWVVPNEYRMPCFVSDKSAEIVPFMAGQTLHWQVAE
jgi:dihydroorotase